MNLSSNSESEDQNFEGHYKKVNYHGNFSDSEHLDSQNEESHSQDSKQHDPQPNNKSDPEKSKTIKKNCESAKMSRQRKKVYLQLLEKRANQLKTEIFTRKNAISAISSKILQKFSRSNREKHAFLLKKIALSKKLLAMNQEIQDSRKALEEKGVMINTETAHTELEKNLSPETLVSMQSAMGLKQEMKSRNRKRKGQEHKQPSNRNESEERLAEKEEYLQLGINAFLYQFGVRGSLRMDVLERTKNEWFENIQKSMHSSDPIAANLQRMRQLLGQLQQKSKKLDYYLRELRGRVKQRFVLQFLLDRQFFIHNSAETIYKKTQMGVSEQ